MPLLAFGGGSGPTRWAASDVYRPTGRVRRLRVTGTLTITNVIDLAELHVGDNSRSQYPVERPGLPPGQYALAYYCTQAGSAWAEGVKRKDGAYLLAAYLESCNDTGNGATSPTVGTPKVRLTCEFRNTADGNATGVYRTSVLVDAGEDATLSSTGDAVVSMDYVMEVECEAWVAPLARGIGTAPNPNEPGYPLTDTAPGVRNSPEAWGGQTDPTHNDSKLLCAQWWPKVGGAFSVALGGATLTGTVPASAGGNLPMLDGVAARASASAYCLFGGTATSTATATVEGQAVKLSGHPTSPPATFSTGTPGLSGGVYVQYDATDGAKVVYNYAAHGTGSFNYLDVGTGSNPGAYNQTTRASVVEAGPVTDYRLKGAVHRGYGPMPVAVGYSYSRASSGAAASDSAGLMVLPVGDFDLPVPHRAWWFNATVVNEPYAQRYAAAWAFGGGLTLPDGTGVAPGFEAARNSLMFRTRAFRPYRWVQPASVALPTNAAASWNYNPAQTPAVGKNVTDIAGGVRLSFTTVGPHAGEQRLLQALYRPANQSATDFNYAYPAASQYATQNVRAWRFFSYDVMVEGADAQPITLSLDNRSWAATTAAAGAWKTVTVDLLGPDSSSSSIDGAQMDSSPNQRRANANPPTANNTVVSWGVEIISNLSLALGQGTAYSLRNLTLSRRENPTLSGFSDYAGTREASLDLDGRRVFEFFWDLVGTQPDHATSAARMLGVQLLQAGPQDDDDWGYAAALQMVGGGGFLNPTPPGASRVVYEQDSGGDVWAQARAVTAQAHPNMGDVFGYGAGTTGPTTLYVDGAAGGATNGVVYDAAGHPLPGGTVRIAETSGSAAGGSGTGRAYGSYKSGAPYFRSDRAQTATGVAGTFAFSPTKPLTVRRICLRGVASTGRGIALLTPGDGSYWCASVDGGALKVRRALNGGPWPQWDTTQTVSTDPSDREPCLAIDPHTNRVELVWQRDDGPHVSHTDAENSSPWSDPVALTTIPGGRNVRTAYDEEGSGLAYGIVDDGGGDAGKVMGAYRHFGDLPGVWSTPFDVKAHPDSPVSPNSVLRVAGTPDVPRGFDVEDGRIHDGRWCLALWRSGDDGPSHWFAVDGGRAFKPASQ